MMCTMPKTKGWPIPPLKYYPGVRVVVNQKVLIDGESIRMPLVLSFNLERSHVPYIMDVASTGKPVQRPLNLLGLCQDSEGKRWMSVAKFYTYEEASVLYGFKSERADKDLDNELVESNQVEHIPVEKIKGSMYVYFCTKREFRR